MPWIWSHRFLENLAMDMADPFWCQKKRCSVNSYIYTRCQGKNGLLMSGETNLFRCQENWPICKSGNLTYLCVREADLFGYQGNWPDGCHGKRTLMFLVVRKALKTDVKGTSYIRETDIWMSGKLDACQGNKPMDVIGRVSADIHPLCWAYINKK